MIVYSIAANYQCLVLPGEDRRFAKINWIPMSEMIFRTGGRGGVVCRNGGDDDCRIYWWDGVDQNEYCGRWLNVGRAPENKYWTNLWFTGHHWHWFIVCISPIRSQSPQSASDLLYNVHSGPGESSLSAVADICLRLLAFLVRSCWSPGIYTEYYKCFVRSPSLHWPRGGSCCCCECASDHTIGIWQSVAERSRKTNP